jgi:uncharacterized membrane protein YoaK (UPF0700 family)
MSSLEIAASPPIRRDETVQVSLLLAFAGGYLDAYAWIIHGVMANAETANLVLLWVYGTTGEWTRALHFVPPIAAFMVGIVIAAWLRRATGDRIDAISTLVEILLLVAVGILQNPLPKGIPDLALGLPVVALLIVLFRCEIRPNEERP